jgi:hypothetical protein
MLRAPPDVWNIGKEIVHLLWAYGAEGHHLRKCDLKQWNGTKMYHSFFRLDADAKGFQVLCYVVRARFCFLLTLRCIRSTTIYYPSAYG